MELSTVLSDTFFQRYCPDPCAIYELHELYAEFNARYFGGELPLLKTIAETDENGEEWVATPTIKWEGRFKRLWGSYLPNGKGTGIIKLARRAALDPVQVRSTLLHELVHAYLDMTGKDDGIKGHGPNFIWEAKRINTLCAQRNVDYRVNFYDEEVTLEQPIVYSDLTKTTIYCGKDLDVALKMQSIFNAAFHDSYEYQQ